MRFDGICTVPRPQETLVGSQKDLAHVEAVETVALRMGEMDENGYLDSASAAFERASALDPNLVDASSEVSHIGSTQNDSIE